MNKFFVALAVSASALAFPSLGMAKGCLKGAAVGGVAGHIAGKHAVLGAAAGCAIEHHREKVKDKAAAQQTAPASQNTNPNMQTKDTTPPK